MKKVIDEEKTFREKGYYSTDLKPKSNKPVYAICEGECCQRKGGIGRWVRFCSYRELCHSCANKSRHILKGENITEKRDYIDDDITYAEKGYRSTYLKPGSHKEVWAVCANPDCEREGGRGRWVEFRSCNDLCSLCVNIVKHGDKIEKRACIDDDITYAEKGYRSTDLKPGSNKPVWCICANPDCEREGGRGRWIKFYACSDLCQRCACITEEFRKNAGDRRIGKLASDETKKLMSESNKGEKHYNWKGGISLDDYCSLFNESLKDAIRNYFDNLCFECGETIEENKCREMSVHHVNYQKNCGCDNTQFCIYVPLCGSCHSRTNHNRWYWYNRFMTELALRNPNYHAYHIPVVFYDEPSYNYSYVFEKNRKRGV